MAQVAKLAEQVLAQEKVAQESEQALVLEAVQDVATTATPGPGNPNGRPGIDAIREPDFGPYMRDLQQRIKRNWDPPKGEESRRVVLLFTIARDGRLLGVSVSKSSGLQSADRAALNAVKLTAPFRPLPAEYRENSVDIQFTFDYNVFGATRR